MTGVVLFAVAAVVAVAAAVRSTWSPCGLSMLSSITPISERAKSHRYYATCAWFVVGAVVGGVTLGLLSAALAAVVSAMSVASGTAIALAAAALVVAAVSDAPGGPHLPFHRRQVNEDWLDEYRPWLYASGFGWQIGVGLATFIMTAGVYALIVLGALTGRPAQAIALGALFGLVRGLAVLLSRNVRTPAQLLALHRRFDRAAAPVRDAVVVVYALGAVALIASAQWVLLAVAVAAGTAAVVAAERRRAASPQPA